MRGWILRRRRLRIDAHLLNHQSNLALLWQRPHNLCQSVFLLVEPLQIGAELYGYQGIGADLDVIGLMAESFSNQ